ncbi:hypothetical protein C0Q70_17319 [Pomacea canaliculata]|uniref:SOCS box domain-containing protein n=1 Tax=Pomacea canaliculata TaxID=400727 RepID=A0A2T7NK35_POMCA|nr:ankyrin repeat domain-containing protein 6-like [Pomacea canaliculata]XP_025113649.1 ankyrin repeat domain-containing protein 6-like [Pomacea canaliculata]PVD21521.1 hypothetical protein C0Q70_17319 [Pomacea canaliculata]
MVSLRELREEIEEGLRERKDAHWHLNRRQQDFIAAITLRNINKVRQLLENGINPNFRDGSGNFPVHIVCDLPFTGEDTITPALLELLLFMGADLQAQDRFGRVPLHLAVAKSPALVTTLLDKGCSINAQDNGGATALMAACGSNCGSCTADVVEILIGHGCNVHIQDKEGNTALHYICKNASLSTQTRDRVVWSLLHAGASATTCRHDGRMPLCLELDSLFRMAPQRLASASLTLVRTLLCAGANIHPRSRLQKQWARQTAVVANPQALCKVLCLAAPVLAPHQVRFLYQVWVSAVGLITPDDFVIDSAQLEIQLQLQSLSCTVPSLRCLCRHSIRAYLRGKMVCRVPLLPLPTALQEFLLSLDER